MFRSAPNQSCAAVTVLCISTLWFGQLPARAQAPPPSPETQSGATRPEVTAAIAVLASPATREEKVSACRRLGAVGGREAITPLAALLADPELAHAACMGLEAIPEPAAGEALRAALPHLTGLPLVGAIDSLAARRETSAVADLGRFLADSDPQVAGAACAALGTIATPEAIALLENSQSSIAEPVRTEWGLGLLRAVEALRKQKQDEQALRLCVLVRESPMSAHVRNAAIRHAMLIRPIDAVPLLQELLSAKDDASFAMALTVSRELVGPHVTQTLLVNLATLPPASQVQVVGVLGDRGDAAARDALVALASGSDPATRAAALRALGRTGDASTIPLLLAAIGDADAVIVTAAQDSLETLPGELVDATVCEALVNVQGSLRPVLIDVVGRRRIESAFDVLVSLIDNADAATRLAALRALGQVSDPPRLSVLTSRLLSATDPDERATVQQALRAACRRAVDRDECARQLQSTATQCEQDTKPFVIELLASVGGPVALEAVATLTQEGDESVQDAATGALGRWRTPDVAPVLIQLARTAPQQKFRIRALRGYLRVMRQMDVTDADKLTMYRQALDTATRDEERQLAVAALGRIPTSEALAEAIKQLESESLRSTACAAAVSIAETLVSSQPEAVIEAMPRVLASTKDAELTRRAQTVLEAGKR